MKGLKKILPFVISLFVASAGFAAMSVDNYFNQPEGSTATDNVLTIGGSENIASGGTLTVQSGGTLTIDSGSTVTYSAMPTFSAGINVDEDVDIDFDDDDEEFNLTTSSGGTTALMTLYNSTTDLEADQWLLSLDFKDNGDANGLYLRCRDNSAANDVLKIGADGAVTIDASGAGSGTVISESGILANDTAFGIDSTSGITISTATDVNTLTLATGGGLTSLAGITAGTSFIIGSADMNETDLEKLDGITNGTAAASKALVLDASLDIATINSLTSIQVLTSTITQRDAAGLRIDAENGVIISTATDVDTLTLAEGGELTSLAAITAGGNVTAVGSFIIGSADMAEADLEKLDGITDGTAAASKALVLDTGSDITGIDSLTATSLTCVNGTADDVNVTYSVACATVVASGGINAGTYVISGSSNIVSVPIMYNLDDTGEISLATLYTGADASIGTFIVYCGTHSAQGTFIADGTVTLAATPSGGSTTSDDTDGYLNVFDNGTSITFENQTGAAAVLSGIVFWQE